jgi:hypothetical protein
MKIADFLLRGRRNLRYFARPAHLAELELILR